MPPSSNPANPPLLKSPPQQQTVHGGSAFTWWKNEGVRVLNGREPAGRHKGTEVHARPETCVRNFGVMLCAAQSDLLTWQKEQVEIARAMAEDLGGRFV